MITGMIHVARPEDPEAIEALADTLAALVAGVASGLVADAVIVSPDAACEALQTIADATGATLVAKARGANPWHAGAAAARRDWVLCLEAGDLPREGWIRAVDRFVGTARPDSGPGRLRRPHAGWSAGIAAGLEALFGAREARAGDVVQRLQLAQGTTFARRLKPRPVHVRLDRA